MFYLEDLEDTAYFQIEQRITAGEHITGPQLAAALKANRGKEIPEAVFHYLCAFLEGKCRKKPGRRSKRNESQHFAVMFLAEFAYKNYLKEERSKRKRQKPSGKVRARADLAAHEAAIKRVQREFFNDSTPAHVANMLSKFRNSSKSRR
jgi:hypothetical protein